MAITAAEEEVDKDTEAEATTDCEVISVASDDSLNDPGTTWSNSFSSGMRSFFW